MILFLYGPDTFRSRQKLNEIKARYQKVHKTGLNLKYFDFKKEKFQDFRDSLAPTPMFKEKKLFILFNAFSGQDFKQEFLKWAKKNAEAEDIILFYQQGDVAKRDSLFKFLKAKAKAQEFKPLTGLKLKNWVQKEFGEHQATINPSALDKLIDFVGQDLWQMSNEIKKLSTYTKTISEQDIELLVKAKIEPGIFKTIDAVAVRNKKLALHLLHQHLEKGDAPLYLLSMINFQFRNLLIVKDLMEQQKPYYTILKEAKLHPFVVKKSIAQAQRFTLEELKKIFRKIFQTDLDIKTGRIEPELALDLLITGI